MLLFWTKNNDVRKLIHGTESWPFYGQQDNKMITYVQKAIVVFSPDGKIAETEEFDIW